MQFWISLWTLIWFAGLVIFAALSVLVIVHGARDLVALLRALRDRHLRREETSSEGGSSA